MKVLKINNPSLSAIRFVGVAVIALMATACGLNQNPNTNGFQQVGGPGGVPIGVPGINGGQINFSVQAPYVTTCRFVGGNIPNTSQMPGMHGQVSLQGGMQNSGFGTAVLNKNGWGGQMQLAIVSNPFFQSMPCQQVPTQFASISLMLSPQAQSMIQQQMMFSQGGAFPGQIPGQVFTQPMQGIMSAGAYITHSYTPSVNMAPGGGSIQNADVFLYFMNSMAPMTLTF
jgi:hypothetical protein